GVDRGPAVIDANDPIVIRIDDPEQLYYSPGLKEPAKVLGMAYITGKYDLGEGYTLKAGTGFAMRMPDLNELYTDEPFTP
ncbi:MAG: hypothetical protein NUV77_16285, partial [Thermoguttaceae bacterium]|nr:hypothetical protein [Thermoguttaceae bacterium]